MSSNHGDISYDNLALHLIWDQELHHHMKYEHDFEKRHDNNVSNTEWIIFTVPNSCDGPVVEAWNQAEDLNEEMKSVVVLIFLTDHYFVRPRPHVIIWHTIIHMILDATKSLLRCFVCSIIRNFDSFYPCWIHDRAFKLTRLKTKNCLIHNVWWRHKFKHLFYHVINFLSFIFIIKILWSVKNFNLEFFFSIISQNVN